MSRLDDILDKPLDPVLYELATRKDNQTVNEIGAEVKTELIDLFLEIVGKNNIFGEQTSLTPSEIRGYNLAKNEIRKKVKKLREPME